MCPIVIPKACIPPSPNLLISASENHFSLNLLFRFFNEQMSLHHLEPLQPHPSNCPSSLSYLLTNTLYHNAIFSVLILQSHFPKRTKLKARKFLIPKPLSSFSLHISSQATKCILCLHSLLPQRNYLKRDSRVWIIALGTMKMLRE